MNDKKEVIKYYRIVYPKHSLESFHGDKAYERAMQRFESRAIDKPVLFEVTESLKEIEIPKQVYTKYIEKES